MKVTSKHCFMLTPRLLFYACRFVDKETGEDVVQDVFMHVWENRERLVMGDTFVSFLYESTYNKVLNILKHEQVKTEKHAEMEVRQRALHYFSRMTIRFSSVLFIMSGTTN